MKREGIHPERASALRRRAEKVAREKAAPSAKRPGRLSDEETGQILHELQVHQIELEMQNEELRQAQVELEASRTRYFDLYDLAPVAYVTLNTKGLLLEANLTAATLFGVGRSELAQQPLHRLVLKEDQDIYYFRRKQLFETGEPQRFDLRMVRKDGEFFWAHLAVASVVDPAGTTVYRAVINDISERKAIEASLEQTHLEAENERLRLETVMDVLPTGVAITDANGGTVRTNKEFERIWAGPRPATRSIEDYGAFKGWWMDTGTVLALDEWASAQAIRAGRTVLGQMLEIEAFDGSRAFVINSAAPIRNSSGGVVGSAVVVQDITALRKAELRIQELNEALQAHVALVDAMNAELESYSHSVSHDLRTPLRFVNRIAHVLLHEPEGHLPKGAARQVNMILQATSEMAKLIENLLIFSQAGREPLKKRRVDMKRLCQETVKELDHSHAGCAAQITVQDLPPIQADRILMKDAVSNLLENALKFTRRRAQARIVIGYTEAPGEIIYYVQDNGVGFDMTASEELFLPFRRLHKQAEFEGTGIGLALVKRIIERHGGRIWAESVVDKGATFYFTLNKKAAE